MKRRDFLVQTGLVSFVPGAALPAPGGPPEVKITDIKTFRVGAGSRNFVFVKVETNQAIRWSIRRGNPYGDSEWTERIADRLGLQTTLRPLGRPKKDA